MNDEYTITDPAEQLVTAGDPQHPGGWIRRNVLEPYGLNTSSTARLIKMNRPTLHNVLEGNHAVSDELAWKLEALTGVDADLIIAMQTAYDRSRNREKRAAIAATITRLERAEER